MNLTSFAISGVIRFSRGLLTASCGETQSGINEAEPIPVRSE